MSSTKKLAQQLGTHGEQIVKDHLMREGFVIVASNMRIRGGEIDLIARKKDLLVCVEVKTRTDNETDLAELITPWQQKRIVTAARHFMVHHEIDEVVCRFDVALVSMNDMPTLSYIPNAFEGEEI